MEQSFQKGAVLHLASLIEYAEGGVISKPKYSVKAKWGVKSNYKLHSVLSTKEYLDLRNNLPAR